MQLYTLIGILVVLTAVAYAAASFMDRVTLRKSRTAAKPKRNKESQE